MQYDDDSGPLSASMIFPFAWPEGADDELSGSTTFSQPHRAYENRTYWPQASTSRGRQASQSQNHNHHEYRTQGGRLSSPVMDTGMPPVFPGMEAEITTQSDKKTQNNKSMRTWELVTVESETLHPLLAPELEVYINGIGEEDIKNSVCWAIIPPLEDILIDIPEFVTCPVCSELLMNPVHWVNCKHVFCKSCVDELVNYGHRECPMCRQILPNDMSPDELQLASDIIIEIQNLPARCGYGFKRSNARTPLPTPSPSPSAPNELLKRLSSETQTSTAEALSRISSAPSSGPSSLISSIEDLYRHLPSLITWRVDPDGCGEVSPLQSLLYHMSECPHAPVRCLYKGCGGVFKRGKIVEHQAKCPHRPVTCEHCLETFTASTLSAHHSECPEMTVTCANNCGAVVTRKLLSAHNLVCPLAPGTHTQSQRGDLTAHLQECPFEKIKGFINSVESVVQSLTDQIHSQQKRIEQLETTIEHQSAQLKELKIQREHPRRHHWGVVQSSGESYNPYRPAQYHSESRPRPSIFGDLAGYSSDDDDTHYRMFSM